MASATVQSDNTVYAQLVLQVGVYHGYYAVAVFEARFRCGNHAVVLADYGDYQRVFWQLDLVDFLA